MFETNTRIERVKVSLNVNLWVSDLIVNPTVPYNYSRFNRVILYRGACLASAKKEE